MKNNKNNIEKYWNNRDGYNDRGKYKNNRENGKYVRINIKMNIIEKIK